MKNSEKTLDMIVNLCKNRGFIYPGSEIYGGLANSWDYGPLGVEFKNNVKKAWLKKFVQESPYNVGLDAAILMNPQVWVTTGHVASFSDPLLDCRACKSRHRADKLIADCEQGKNVDVDAMTFDEMDAFIASHEEVVCPVCGKHDFTPIRKFNLMFKTAIGVTEDSSSTCYLRPETAQGIFVNFANIQRTTRRKLPFGVCQVGKAFRNEITPGNFTFRTREFEQMECEFFCKPDTDLEWFAYWKDTCKNWLLSLGIKEENLRLRDHEPAELAFYSRATTDIEYAFPFTDWGELWGIADRTNYDLTRHQEASGKSLEYFDPETNEHYIPYVIEPSLGCDRVALAFLCEAYDEEHMVDAKGKEDVRTVLRLHPFLAPFKCAVLPLSKKLSDKAMEIRNELAKDFMVDFDDAGSIGKRYRRQDEIGTPLCITVDFQTVGDDKTEADNCVTVRDRDTMEQVRMPISELKDYIAKKIAFCFSFFNRNSPFRVLTRRGLLFSSSKVGTVRMGVLAVQSHRNAQGFVHPAHIVGRDAPRPFPQAAFVQRADLLGQHDAVLAQAAAVRPHIDMGGQAVFVLAAGDGRRDNGRAVPVPDLILDDKYRPDAALLRSHHRAQVGIKYFASVYFHEKTSSRLILLV